MLAGGCAAPVAGGGDEQLWEVQSAISTAIAGPRPTGVNDAVCDSGTEVCVPCDGDKGQGSKDACPAYAAPFCFGGGAQQGRCGKFSKRHRL